MTFISRIFWLIPFFFFFAGYYTISWLIGAQTVSTPSLTGKRLQDVVTLLTPYQLNLRILGEIEDGTLPEGTVIAQKPLAGQKIKFYQSVGVTISRHPAHAVAPSMTGLSQKECGVQGEKESLRLKLYWCESSYPKDQCIAQHPTAGTALPDRAMTVYLSKGQTPLRIVPNVQGFSVPAIQDFCKEHGITLTVQPGPLDPNLHYRVVGQKPTFGSLIDISLRPFLQIYVQPDLTTQTS
jgi:beta-lactam-binding protein with PASTA domain